MRKGSKTIREKWFFCSFRKDNNEKDAKFSRQQHKA
jgi:hypothetical protein